MLKTWRAVPRGVLDVDNAKQLTDFMQYLSSNLAREVARITGWKQKIWAARAGAGRRCRRSGS